MLKLQPLEHEICDISNCTGVSWNAQSRGVLEEWMWSSSGMPEHPLGGGGRGGHRGEMFSISLLKYAEICQP